MVNAKTCRACGVPVTDDNARTYMGTVLTICRKCENAQSRARQTGYVRAQTDKYKVECLVDGCEWVEEHASEACARICAQRHVAKDHPDCAALLPKGDGA